MLRYVISHKPSPAVFADTSWSSDVAEKDIRNFMEKTEGKCHVELIMKDISTVKYQPEKLWAWEKIAMRISEEFGV